MLSRQTLQLGFSRYVAFGNYSIFIHKKKKLNYTRYCDLLQGGVLELLYVSRKVLKVLKNAEASNSF